VLAGLTDEYFTLGAKLRVNHTLGPGPDDPSALRPPGYPLFIAGVLQAFVGDPRDLSASEFAERGMFAVGLAQCALLGATAAALFLWIGLHTREGVALAVALAFGLNPYSIVLAGLLHYDVLHWCSLVLACWALDRARAAEEPGRAALLAGIVWGASNLVRPVTLGLPFLWAPMLLAVRTPPRRLTRLLVGLMAGLVLSLAPWTVRNERVTGRIVPVADNLWATLWGQTFKPIVPKPNRYVWFELYRDGLVPVFQSVTGLPAYDYVAHVRNNTRLEAAFKEEALRHLRSRPRVYLTNAARDLVSLGASINSSLLAVYQRIQRPPYGGGGYTVTIPQSWFLEGADPEVRSPLSACFAAWMGALTVLAVWGAVRAIRLRDAFWTVPAATYLAASVTHAAIFTHMMHYYLKVPFVFAFVAYGLGAVRGAATLPMLSRAAVGVLVISTLGMTIVLLFG
jgi:hypothetical protein